jgi:hypothetical protein
MVCREVLCQGKWLDYVQWRDENEFMIGCLALALSRASVGGLLCTSSPRCAESNIWLCKPSTQLAGHPAKESFMAASSPDFLCEIGSSVNGTLLREPILSVSPLTRGLTQTQDVGQLLQSSRCAHDPRPRPRPRPWPRPPRPPLSPPRPP